MAILRCDLTFCESASRYGRKKTLIARIGHFFEHYKDLEPNKWVKVQGWEGAEKARQLIQESIERAQK